MQTPRTEFAQALRAVATERNLDADVILETIKQAIIAAYRRDAREHGDDTEELEFDAEIDPTSGEAKVFAWPLDKPEKRKDVTPPGFGRIAAQTAKQVIHQKIREAEKGAVMEEFSVRVGNLISGMILRFDGPDVRVDLGRTEGLMPKEERVPNERLNPNQRLTFLLKDIQDTLKGKQIVLSRASSEFVKKLFEREVPEISSGSVEVRAIAREAGVRTKMAVYSNQSGVDPVGSCVGQKGVRVQAVTNELGGERIDIIPWNDSLPELIKASLSPAEGISVVLDEGEKIAKIKAPEDQLSLAIGKDGQNVRLAAKLTGWKIEIKETPVSKKTKKEVETALEEKKKASKTEGKEEVEPEDVKKVKKDEKPESEIEKVEKKEDSSQQDDSATSDDTNQPATITKPDDQKEKTASSKDEGLMSDNEK